MEMEGGTDQMGTQAILLHKMAIDHQQNAQTFQDVNVLPSGSGVLPFSQDKPPYRKARAVSSPRRKDGSGVVPGGANDFPGIHFGKGRHFGARFYDATRRHMGTAAQHGVVVHNGTAVDDAACTQVSTGAHVGLGQYHAAGLQHGAGADEAASLI